MTKRGMFSPETVALRRSLVMVMLVAAGGTLGYIHTEGWGVWDALFFTLVTITTVGYSDQGLSERGQQFTVLVMLVGIGTLTYAAGQIIHAVMRAQYDRRRRMERHLKLVRDHFLICGLGQIGMVVAQCLEERGMPFVVVDTDPAHIENAMDRGWLGVKGSGTDEAVLTQAGLFRARGIVVLTGSDTENIVVALTARQLRDDVDIIARVERSDSVAKMRHAGASRVISPGRVGAERIADALTRPTLVAMLDPPGEETCPLRLGEVPIERGSGLAGAQLKTWGMAHPAVSVVGIRTPEGTRTRPRSDERLREGDVLLVAGTRADLEALVSAAA